jgi:hypothetical protein
VVAVVVMVLVEMSLLMGSRGTLEEKSSQLIAHGRRVITDDSEASSVIHLFPLVGH